MANPQLDDLMARASAALGRMADLSDAYAGVRGEGRDARGLVTARVDGAGALVGLELDRAAMRLGAAELGDLIASTAMLAAQRAFAQRAGLTDEFNREFGEFAADDRGRAGARSATEEGDR